MLVEKMINTTDSPKQVTWTLKLQWIYCCNQVDENSH